MLNIVLQRKRKLNSDFGVDVPRKDGRKTHRVLCSVRAQNVARLQVAAMRMNKTGWDHNKQQELRRPERNRLCGGEYEVPLLAGEEMRIRR